MSNLYKCPMCGYTLAILVEKEFVKSDEPLLCPECLLKNEHMDKRTLESWIKMELVTEGQGVK